MSISNIGRTNTMMEAYSAQKTTKENETKSETKVEQSKAKGLASAGLVSKSSEYGKTVGEPKLSETAKSYYEELKKKYGNMDFILVSKDQKENAKANAARYANPAKMVVLIDEEKIERMATDENYRAKYEAIIAGAGKNLESMKNQLSSTGAQVKGYGMQVNEDGSTSLFAVLKDSSKAQKERIEAKREQKKADKKAAEKKEEKLKRQERIENAKAQKTQQKEEESDVDSISKNAKAEDGVVFTADSMEELLNKVGDYMQNVKMNEVLTTEEQAVGQTIDFRG